MLTVDFNKDVVHDGSASSANNVINYLLVEQGADQLFNTLSCAGGRAGDDQRTTIVSATYANHFGMGPFQATLNLAAPLQVGYYRLFVCGTTSIKDRLGGKLNGGADTLITFRVTERAPQKLPKTGFSPQAMTILPAQPTDQLYNATSLSLSISRLGLNAPIVGVPLINGDWDVSWLGADAGWLNGTAFPTWSGNSVLTGHVWNADNTPGIFLQLKTLAYGDQVRIHAWGQTYIYEVRENRLLAPTEINVAIEHRDETWLTLLSCESYNTLTDSYTWRRMVRAVLVSVVTNTTIDQ